MLQIRNDFDKRKNYVKNVSIREAITRDEKTVIEPLNINCQNYLLTNRLLYQV